MQQVNLKPQLHLKGFITIDSDNEVNVIFTRPQNRPNRFLDYRWFPLLWESERNFLLEVNEKLAELADFSYEKPTEVEIIISVK